MNEFIPEWIEEERKRLEPLRFKTYAEKHLERALYEISRLQSRVAELEAQLKEPIIANCFINGEGIKEGWGFSGYDDKCIVTPKPPKEE